jgi:hypothetical protein
MKRASTFIRCFIAAYNDSFNVIIWNREKIFRSPISYRSVKKDVENELENIVSHPIHRKYINGIENSQSISHYQPPRNCTQEINLIFFFFFESVLDVVRNISFPTETIFSSEYYFKSRGIRRNDLRDLPC